MSATKKCIVDGTPLKSKRKDARFCSDKCRKAYARDNNIDTSTGEIKIPEEDKYHLPEPQHEKEVSSSLVRDPFGRVEDLVDWHRFGNGDDPLYIDNPFQRPKDPNYDREANLKAFRKMGLDSVTWVTTGLKEFDDLTKIPRGRITQIQGPYGVGKTTLCLNMANGISVAHKILYIDSEASLNPELIVDLGINKDNFTLYNKSAALEDISEVIRSAAKSGTYEVVIFDSLAAVTTKAIQENDFTASNIGQKAKLMHKLVSLVQMDLRNSNTALVVVNQEREVLGGYVPQKYTPGGMAIPYAASLMVALKTIKSWRFPAKPKDGLFHGHEVEATIIKSKVNTPWRVSKFKLYYPQPHEDVSPKMLPGEF